MSFEVIRRQLAGVVAITVTPFDARDQVDEAALKAVTQRMVLAGIEVVTPNGNTGEYYSLTVQERRTCLAAVVEAAADALVLAGVGGALPDALVAAREAEELGAGAIMVHQPPHPYLTQQGWAEYHRAIAESVPTLGVVPYVRNPRVAAETVGELARRLPNVVGVKYAVPDPVAFAAMCADVDLDGMVWIAGLAESQSLALFATKATGFTSGLANVAPELSLALLAALRERDRETAFDLWSRIRGFEELRARDDNALNVSVVKEALCQLGLSDRGVRPPISPLAPADRTRVAELLAGWNLTARSLG
jgi:4-hydroxy-tetrahydrodipicolinate synthase